ncbi:MAG: family 16 glycoside hydrolase [Chloroflexota bacterium]
MTDKPSQKRLSSDYQQKTINLQHTSRKVKGSMLGRGIGLVIGSIILATIVIFGVAILKDQSTIILLGGGLISLAFFFNGLSMVLQFIFRKTRTVKCPYCGAKYSLFHSVKSYVCDKCNHVLRFSGDEKELVQVTCPDCDFEWAASPNTGATRCFNCGVKGAITGGKARFNNEWSACPNCTTENPSGIYFCWHCGVLISPPEPVKDPEGSVVSESISVEPNSDGMDFISQRAASPVGLMYNAAARINQIISESNQLPDENYKVLSLARQVGYSLEDMQEALRSCPEYGDKIRGILPDVSRVTARILKGIKIGTMAYGDTDRYNSHWRDLSAQFNQLTSKVNPGVNVTMEKIGWPAQLVKVSRGRAMGGNSNPPQFETVIDNDADIRDWVKRTLPEGPLAPISLAGILNLEEIPIEKTISSTLATAALPQVQTPVLVNVEPQTLEISTPPFAPIASTGPAPTGQKQAAQLTPIRPIAQQAPISNNKGVILVIALVVGVLLVGMICFFAGITLFNKGFPAINFAPATFPNMQSTTVADSIGATPVVKNSGAISRPTNISIPTRTLTPTETFTPTITFTPTNTEIPTITMTPTDRPLSVSLAPAGWKVIYQDSFDGSTSDNWRVGNRTLTDFFEEMKDGKLVFLMGQEGHGGSLIKDVPDGMLDLDDFYARVEVRQPVGQNKATCGLMYRYVDAFDYYSFGIHGSPAFSIVSFVDIKYAWLADEKSSNLVSARKVNVLEIIAREGSIQLFINGEAVYKDSKPAIPKGTVGLIANTLSDPQALTCEFDNFEVRAP